MPVVQCDVCVIGGGPAGAAAAIQLVRAGMDVVIVEAAVFPRRKIGESLPPSIIPILEVLGVRDEIESAGFPRPNEAIVRWRSAATTRPRFVQSTDAGFQADRAIFDTILLAHARRVGARLLTPARVTGMYRHADEWHLSLATPLHVNRVVCSFVVDTAGRRGVVRKGQRRRLTPATVALHAYWTDHGFSGPQTRIEAGENCWYWAAPFSKDCANVAVFIDPKEVRKSRLGLQSTYEYLLSQSTLLKNCLRGRRVGPVKGSAAAMETRSQLVGDNFIFAGDAALAVDPLSAQGTVLALTMGTQSAAVTNTIRSSSGTVHLAKRFYEDQVTNWTKHYLNITADFYRERAGADSGVFWTERSMVPPHYQVSSNYPASDGGLSLRLKAETRLMISPETRLEPVVAMIGNRVQEVLAFTHPTLQQPIAFVGGVAAVRVANKLQKSLMAYELAASLIPLMGEDAAIASVKRLWNARIIHTPQSGY